MYKQAIQVVAIEEHWKHGVPGIRGTHLPNRSRCRAGQKLYLAPNRSRLFAVLPELTIPRGFKWARLKEFVDLVASAGRKTFLEARMRQLKRAA